MELKDFIKTALVDIRMGVKEANEELDDECYQVHALSQNPEKSGVNFDVAVTVNTAGKDSAKAGLNVAVAQLGANIENSSSHEHVSRVKFMVQISGSWS